MAEVEAAIKRDRRRDRTEATGVRSFALSHSATRQAWEEFASSTWNFHEYGQTTQPTIQTEKVGCYPLPEIFKKSAKQSIPPTRQKK